LHTHTIKYELMASILVKAVFGFGNPKMGHVLPMQANYVESKIIFYDFFLHKYDL